MAQQSAFNLWLSCMAEEKPCVLATILQTDPSREADGESRILIPKDGDPVGNIPYTDLYKEVIQIARNKLQQKNPKSETLVFSTNEAKEINIFIDVYMPSAELIIFGAGHDAIPVAKYALSLGWKTTVVDPRAYYNSEERFPHTNRILADTSKFEDNVSITERTYIIVMNHHIERDQETLKFVLNSPAPYIGVLGPRKRRVRMMEAIQHDGYRFDEKQLNRMYSPIGLDIGSESPEEIAISMMAEIIAVKNGHKGGFLQDSNYIHLGSQVDQP